ncbi:DnaA regulatory inactivator Hda [Leucothrix pacifica]|uniref:DnaA regulatory inactivator Hda n=1 Tax=Leucothrix pacifica TaxID=1247513 RepID=A0A317CLS0_9GAMM|nr:DnaA regulatory inactivator Hda [Leucothrix pacifica]PWQ97240.1 DnaA regulatory inactivator Hda [Leucothrix pacifica]
MTFQQMTLNVTSRDGLKFDSFFETEENHDVVMRLKNFAETDQSSQVFIWGEMHSGKSHLLQACCYDATERGQRVSYLPLKALGTYGTASARGLEKMNLIVVDDVDLVVGNLDWEEALFDLINNSRISRQRLLFSASENPRHMECKLPDLSSRLIWGESYNLQSLSDQDKNNALRQRAAQRGLELNDRVLEYLNRHYPRDMGSMLTILDVIDEESLRKQSKITVPFLKQVLDS